MIDPIVAIAAGLAVGLTGLGTAYAEAHIGAAVAGLVAEDEKNFSKGLIFLVIPETIIVFGFAVAAMLIFMT